VKQRPGNFDDLLFACAKLGDFAGGIQIRTKSAKDLAGLFKLFGLPDLTQMMDFPAQKKIVDDRKGVYQGKLLVDDRDTRLASLDWAQRGIRFRLYGHFSRIWAQDPRQNPHECAFARAIGTQESYDLAGSQLKIYTFENLSHSERFSDLTEFKKWLDWGHCSGSATTLGTSVKSGAR
jgi:hypothetical protein